MLKNLGFVWGETSYPLPHRRMNQTTQAVISGGDLATLGVM
jgi:hypothetical protein